MSYYNDFALALEQQSNDLDNMLAELNSFNNGNYSGALESVQNTVAGIYNTDACETLLDNLEGVVESYNSALRQMRDAAEVLMHNNDREDARRAMQPAQESLKEIYYNITGYAPEGAINQEIIGDIHHFLVESKNIIEGRMSELGGMRGGMESYNECYPMSDLDAAIEQARFEYEDSMAGVYACMEAGYAQYGYAFEAETSGAEKAKKEGLFQRAKNAFVKWCAVMADRCAKKRAAAKNNALKGVWNAFYGVFMRLSGQGKTLKEERALEKAEKQAQKETERLKKELEKNGGNPNEVPAAPHSAEDALAAFGAGDPNARIIRSGEHENEDINESQRSHYLNDTKISNYQRERDKKIAADNRTAMNIYQDIKAVAKKVASLKNTGGPDLMDAKRELNALRTEMREKVANSATASDWDEKISNSALGLESYLSILNVAEAICEAALGVEDFGLYNNDPVNTFFSML